MKNVGDLFDLVLNIEITKEEKLIENRVRNYILPSFLDAVIFEKLATYDQGRQLLRDALLRTLEELRSKVEIVDAPVEADVRSTMDEAAKLEEAFQNVEATFKDSLAPEELAQRYYFERMDALRKHFNQKYDAQFGFDFKGPASLKGFVFQNGYEQMKEGIEKTIKDLQENIDKQKPQPLVMKEVKFFQMRALMQAVESRLVEFQDYLHETEGPTYMLDRTQIDVVNYSDFSSSGEAFNQAKVARDQAMISLREKMEMASFEKDVIVSIEAEQSQLSELILHIKRLESDVCYSGDGGSLLSVCQNDQRLLADSATRLQTSKRWAVSE